jgi:transposase-like protein
VLARWRHDYALRGEAAFTPPTSPSATALERKIVDLERRCQQLVLENTILKNALPAAPTRSGMLR